MTRPCLLLATLIAVLGAAPALLLAEAPIATFSIVACDRENGELGVAVQSKFFAVGAVVPWAEAGVGAIATQAYGNTSFGPRGLAMLAEGLDVEAVLAELLKEDPQAQQRQVGIVDAQGRSAAYTGKDCMAWAGQRSGPDFSVQGNILAGEAVVDAMAAAYLATAGEMLGERLLHALEAGQAAGGDSRGRQSAALLVVREGAGYGGYNDRYCDLRVDDNAQPIVELRRLFHIWKVDALILEGYRLCESDQWDEAFAAGRQAVELAPLEGEPYYHLACYLAKAGRWEEALAELDLAVQRDAALGAQARQDPDFKPHWRDPAFLGITGR